MKRAFFLITFFLAGCAATPTASLNRLHLVDRNGLTETISNEERLKKYEQVDFLDRQSYEKVLRVYKPEKDGKIRGYLTSYHPNGSIYQYLELVNSRASGSYKEWHPSGALKVEATVVGGTGDLTESAKKTYLFDGPSFAYSPSGELEAKFLYANGKLEGFATYYQNQKVVKRVPYKAGEIDGEVVAYYPNGAVAFTTTFKEGKKEGEAKAFDHEGALLAEELYQKDLLVKGSYTKEGEAIGGVLSGRGKRAVFKEGELFLLQEYDGGIVHGRVEEYSENGHLKKSYTLIEGVKNGEEATYFLPGPFTPESSAPRKKLSVSWVDGVISGEVKTFYPGGQMESRREFSQNKKEGLSTAWYESGEVMLVERYEKDKLISGKYFQKGSKTPISQVIDGKGTATLFDGKGNLKKKIPYENGAPLP